MANNPRPLPLRLLLIFFKWFVVKRIPFLTEKHTEVFKDGVCSFLPNNVDMCIHRQRAGAAKALCVGGGGERALRELFLCQYVDTHVPLLPEHPKTNQNVILPKAYLGKQ